MILRFLKVWKIGIDISKCLCYDCGNSEKAMKRNSTYTRNFREKMVGENLYSKISKQSRSFGPNDDSSRWEDDLVGFNVFPRYRGTVCQYRRECRDFSEFRW